MKKVVILDAGHGGINPITKQYVTPGKRSPIWKDGTQYFEGVGNREIVQLASRILKGKGVTVFYTVDPSDYRDVSLSERVRIANKIFKSNPDAFLISVHSNAASDPTAHGSEIWTWPGQTKSDVFATVFMQEFVKLHPLTKVRADYSDGDIDKESMFTINSVNCPSFLIESMFHTNEVECKILMSQSGKEAIANSIVNTVIRIVS